VYSPGTRLFEPENIWHIVFSRSWPHVPCAHVGCVHHGKRCFALASTL